MDDRSSSQISVIIESIIDLVKNDHALAESVTDLARLITDQQQRMLSLVEVLDSMAHRLERLESVDIDLPSFTKRSEAN